MSPARAVLLPGLLLALGLAACATGDPRAARADALLDGGDFDGAFVRYALALAEHPGDEALTRKLASARELSWAVHRERAADAIDRGDWAGATAELQRVVELNPEDREAKDRLREIEEQTAASAAAVREAQGLLAAGDAAGARRVLAPHRTRLDAHPDGLETLRKADARVRDDALAAAGAALARGDFPTARDEAKRALGVPPPDPRARRLIERAETGLEAEALSRRAEAAGQAGDYRAAMEGFRQALLRWPGLPAAEAGLRAARAAGARENLEAASREIGAGRIGTALERIEAAEALGAASAPGHEEVRGELARALERRGEANLAAGRPALAVLDLDRASALGSESARIAEARRALDEALRVRVRVAPVQNATAESLDTLGIGRSAVARMLADGVLTWIDVIDDGPADVTIEPCLTAFVVRRSLPVSRPRRVRYVDHVVREPNPDFVDSEQRLRAAESDEREASLRMEDERKQLEILLRNRWDAWHLDSRRGSGQPEAARAAYESAVLLQRSRVRDRERVWNQATARSAALRDRLSRLAPTVERPVYATHEDTEITRTASGRAVATVVVSAGDGAARMSTEAYSGFSLDDTSAPAFQPASIPADPDDLPTDEEARASLIEGLVTALAKRMRESVESLALRHLEGADALSPDDRAERWTRFLLSGVAGPDRLRGELRAKLREATGLTVPPLPGSIQEGGG